MEPRLDVITLAVADLERALAFYRRLGLESNGVVATEWTDEQTGANGAIAMFKLDGGLLLNLYPRSDLAKDAAIPVGPPQSGEFSLAQRVRSRGAVDELLENAVAAGGTVTPAHDRPWGIYSGYFRDPDGHLWEVISKANGAPQSPDRAAPFTLRNLKRDLEDIGSVFDGPPDLEFRAATKALALEQSALTHQRVPPGYRFHYGHTHETQEEVYVVVRGSGRMKLDEQIVELREWDAVRVPPGTWRGYEAGPEGLEILVIGAPNLGEDPREDVEGRRDWWAD